MSSGTPRLVSSETLSARTRLSVHSREKRESRARGLGPRVRRDERRESDAKACRQSHAASAIWLGFKGGKGVATYIGLLLALAWPIAIAFALIWLAVVALSRYSSLAALLASAATPVALWMIGDQPAAVLFTLLSVLLWIMHRGNIARLVRGTESKLGASTPA